MAFTHRQTELKSRILLSTIKTKYKIFCDETWTSGASNTKKKVIVFYGVMLEEPNEGEIINQINEYKRLRGLFQNGKYVELKWVEVEEEWKNSKKQDKESRYEELINIFINNLRSKRISFGYLFLDKRKYDSIELEFLDQQNDNKHNFFFMLYFQFLYHCFIKNQVKQSPCEIYIDNHDMGAEGRNYDIDKLKEVLNWKTNKEIAPKYQLPLSYELQRQLIESIQLVNLAESKDNPLIQMADVCAGCVRYLIENEVPTPPPLNQPSLFQEATNAGNLDRRGKWNLANSFYTKLRSISGYDDINLCNPSRHHRFNIFPFHFQDKK